VGKGKNKKADLSKAKNQLRSAKQKQRGSGSDRQGRRKNEPEADYDDMEIMETDCDPADLELLPPEDEYAAPIVRPFKLASVGPDFTQAFIGKRREGKSFCMRWIAHSVVEKFPRW
jgi:hypothetical protein